MYARHTLLRTNSTSSLPIPSRHVIQALRRTFLVTVVGAATPIGSRSYYLRGHCRLKAGHFPGQCLDDDSDATRINDRNGQWHSRVPITALCPQQHDLWGGYDESITHWMRRLL
jgi:hypothetical protein